MVHPHYESYYFHNKFLGSIVNFDKEYTKQLVVADVVNSLTTLSR